LKASKQSQTKSHRTSVIDRLSLSCPGLGLAVPVYHAPGS